MQASEALVISSKIQTNTEDTINRVCRYVDKKIATAATLGEQDTMCSIPQFIPDTMQFRMEPMIQAVIVHLIELGYYTRQLGTNTVYVSWRFPLKPCAEPTRMMTRADTASQQQSPEEQSR